MRITADQADISAIEKSLASVSLTGYSICSADFDIYKANPNHSQNGVLRISDGGLFRISIPVYRSALNHAFIPDNTYYDEYANYNLLKYHTGLVQVGERYQTIDTGITGTLRRVQTGFVEAKSELVPFVQVVTEVLLTNHPLKVDGTGGVDTSGFTQV